MFSRIKYITSQYVDNLNNISVFTESVLNKRSIIAELKSLSLNKEQALLVDNLCSENFRKMYYNASIIGIYSCYESFVDMLLCEFLEIILGECDKDDKLLPKSIRQKYKDEYLSFLSNENRFSHLDLKVDDVMENYMNFCNNNFLVADKELIVNHHGNLSINILIGLLASLAIKDSIKFIFSDNEFKDFIVDSYGETEESYAKKSNHGGMDYFRYLNDLVFHRNIIAHGWDDDSRLSVSDILTKTIPFMKMFGSVLMKLIFVTYEKLFSDSSHGKVDVCPIDVFNHNIVCFHVENIDFSVGDYIIYGNKKKYKCAKIKRIEIDKKAVKKIEGVSSDIGAELDRNISCSDQIYRII